MNSSCNLRLRLTVVITVFFAFFASLNLADHDVFADKEQDVEASSYTVRRLNIAPKNNKDNLHMLKNMTDVEIFHAIATKLNPVSDKVTTHRYAEFYGSFLIPYVRRRHHFSQHTKMLEIGLGCNMGYGPGASVKIWREILLSTDQLWEAEYNGKCVKESQEKGQLDEINVLIGDQSDKKTLEGWIKDSGNNFDIIIDDGGGVVYAYVY